MNAKKASPSLKSTTLSSPDSEPTAQGFYLNSFSNLHLEEEASSQTFMKQLEMFKKTMIIPSESAKVQT